MESCTSELQNDNTGTLLAAPELNPSTVWYCNTQINQPEGKTSFHEYNPFVRTNQDTTEDTI